jgi:cytochrome c553
MVSVKMVRKVKRLLVFTAMVAGSMSTAAHAVTAGQVSAACGPCHGLTVNGVVVSTGPGLFGFTAYVTGRNQANWVSTITRMIHRGAMVADVNGTAAYLAGLDVQSATPTTTPTATGTPGVQPTASSPTPPPTPPACTGDCDGSGDVTVNELITMVNIALGNTPLSACPIGDADGSGDITVNEIIQAVGFALTRCPAM